MSASEQARIILLHRGGLSYTEIAKKTGYSRQGVTKALNRHFSPRRPDVQQETLPIPSKTPSTVTTSPGQPQTPSGTIGSREAGKSTAGRLRGAIDRAIGLLERRMGSGKVCAADLESLTKLLKLQAEQGGDGFKQQAEEVCKDCPQKTISFQFVAGRTVNCPKCKTEFDPCHPERYGMVEKVVPTEPARVEVQEPKEPEPVRTPPPIPPKAETREPQTGDEITNATFRRGRQRRISDDENVYLGDDGRPL